MNSNIALSIRSEQTGVLKIEQADSLLSSCFAKVREARTFADIEEIRDVNAQIAAWSKSRRVAVAMGDRIPELQAKVREIYLECDLKLGELSKSVAPTDKKKLASDLGVPRNKLTICERAASVPRKTIDLLREVQRAKGLDIDAGSVSQLHDLDRDGRRAVFAKLGDVSSVYEAAALVHSELAERADRELKVAPEWKPSPPASGAEGCSGARVNLVALEYEKIAIKLRAACNTLCQLASANVSRPSEDVVSRLIDVEVEASNLFDALVQNGTGYGT